MGLAQVEPRERPPHARRHAILRQLGVAGRHSNARRGERFGRMRLGALLADVSTRRARSRQAAASMPLGYFTICARERVNKSKLSASHASFSAR